MLGSSPPAGFALGGAAPTVAPVGLSAVDLLTERSAELVSVGPTSAQFDRPAVAATFERAPALVFV